MIKISILSAIAGLIVGYALAYLEMRSTFKELSGDLDKEREKVKMAIKNKDNR